MQCEVKEADGPNLCLASTKLWIEVQYSSIDLALVVSHTKAGKDTQRKEIDDLKMPEQKFKMRPVHNKLKIMHKLGGALSLSLLELSKSDWIKYEELDLEGDVEEASLEKKEDEDRDLEDEDHKDLHSHLKNLKGETVVLSSQVENK